MHRISSTIVGAAGEYHVLSQLLRRGWIAALALDGAARRRSCTTENGDGVHLQILTERGCRPSIVRRPRWAFRKTKPKPRFSMACFPFERVPAVPATPEG